MNYNNIIKQELITKGWSTDKKYKVTLDDDRELLLRVSSESTYGKKMEEYEMMIKVYELKVHMSKPIHIELSNEEVLFFQSWIKGVDLKDVIHTFNSKKQYDLGYEAGRILKSIHSIQIDDKHKFDWSNKFNEKIDIKIKNYKESSRKYEKGQLFIDYINKNRDLLNDRPISFHHGDYHIGNMMIDNKGDLTIIDFDRSDYGDPWEEFNRIVWCVQESYEFASGMVNGYFNGKVPLDFWKLLKLYIVANSLSSIYWAIQFGEDQVQIMREQANEILEWYDDMKKDIPTWYIP